MSQPLEVEGLSVGYRHRGGARVILADVNARVAAGELVGLVGPNGVGKSTLLRSIAGLQPVFGGVVRLLGDPIDHLSRRERARRMALVLTDRFEPGRLRVRDVVGLGRFADSSWTGRLDARDERIVEVSLAATGAIEFADVLLAELSDGQRQRVMVARALAQQPKVLLLDEPTAFLDPPGRIELAEVLKAVSASGVAVVVCTHDIDVMLRVADRLWVVDLRRGLIAGTPAELVADGTIADSFERPGVVFDEQTWSFRPRGGGASAADGRAAASAMPGNLGR